MQGKIKMVYIDPPYNANSGQHFYYDDYRETVKHYLASTGRNPRNSKVESFEIAGRFHSRWLSMIFPRLLLARNLLTEDGAMFVSIDDTEIYNLGLIMREIFGEENVETMIWRKVDSNEGKLKIVRRFRLEHEYILVGYRNKGAAHFKKVDEIPHFKNPVENVDGDPRGDWISGNMSSTEQISKKGGKNYYIVTSPGGRKFARQWKFPSAEFERLNRDNRIYWGRNRNNVPRLKVFAGEPRSVYVSSIIEGKGTAKRASRDMSRLPGSSSFPNPKPVELIQYLIDAAETRDAIVMDFFAGSGTTAHAVLAQNAIDSGNRSFLLVQLPEQLNSNKAKTGAVQNSAEITRLRIQAVIGRGKKATKTLPGQDLGMKVLQLVN
jgi:adenine-specific DNA-methyltransferase